MAHYYVLDGNVFLSRPEVIAAIETDAQVYVPEIVIHEMTTIIQSGRISRFKVGQVVGLAERHGGFRFERPLPEQYTETYQDALLSALRSGLTRIEDEVAVIATVLSREHGLAAVTVVTESPRLESFLRSNGISSLRVREFLKANSALVSRELFGRYLRLSRQMFARTLLSIFGGVLVSIFLAMLFTQRARLFSTFPVWGTLTIFPITGIFFYWFRERYRLIYGAAETGVGLLTMYGATFVTFDFASISYEHPGQILGGLYIMVRGLDNLAKGLKGTRLEPIWNRFFPVS
ncbi:PIN domain-containing protein [Paraburkholderia youngii]|uniref:PIN domain-containing protein n=1 Tax=Paraburkholderia youngii TaxID=2782701 RepID=UPI003D255926